MDRTENLPTQRQTDRGLQPMTGPGGTLFPILRRRWDSMLGEMFQDLEALGGGSWMSRGFPSLDVREHDGEIRVEAELPGVDADDLDVKLDGRTLTIRGEKKTTRESEEGAPHRIERFFGSFRRDVPLPADVDADSCDAVFRDGMLRVTMKKSPGTEARELKIES